MTDNPISRAIERHRQGWSSFFFDAWVSIMVNGISGDYVEFGSWGANSFWACYSEMRNAGLDRHLWAFDSFRGLPPATDARDLHPGWQPGVEMDTGGVAAFYAACDERGIPRQSYTVTEGFFEDTLGALGRSGQPTDIALAYVDCNMYSSTKTVLEFLEPRLKHGMIVAFDDWFCWTPDAVSAERWALQEFLDDHPDWHFERYKDVHRAGVSFIVERADAVPGRGR